MSFSGDFPCVIYSSLLTGCYTLLNLISRIQITSPTTGIVIHNACLAPTANLVLDLTTVCAWEDGVLHLEIEWLIGLIKEIMVEEAWNA